NSMIAQRNAARGGLGIVALPHFALSDQDSLIRIMPDLSVTRTLWLTVHQDLRHLPHIVALKKFLAQLFQEDATYLAGE
ncbi:LysR substrate-binding domain-containing protein, partial [Staphylococcus pasteuri_A]